MTTKFKMHCPVCDRDFLMDNPEPGCLNDYIGYTMECPLCLSVIKLNGDLTFSNFEKELREKKGKRGVNLEGETIGCFSA